MKNSQTHNESILTPDTSLATEISDALANDARTRDAIIEVINDRGVITLAGSVDSVETQQAAEEIAKSHSGVVSVVNALRIE